MAYIRSIEGDDMINIALMNAMESTIRCLVNEEKMSVEDANKFLLSHVCFIANKDGAFSSFIKNMFGIEKDKVLVAKVNSK